MVGERLFKAQGSHAQAMTHRLTASVIGCVKSLSALFSEKLSYVIPYFLELFVVERAVS